MLLEYTCLKEEAKARYWAVKIQPQWLVTPGKQTKKQITWLYWYSTLRQTDHFPDGRGNIVDIYLPFKQPFKISISPDYIQDE